MSTALDPISRWSDSAQLFRRQAQFGNETGKLANGYFEPGPDNMKTIYESKILVIGAGGLGCELLKDLALSGFINIHVIDLDTIDVSNLNRQFLFRAKDVGRPKSTVAAEFIMQRVTGCVVTAYQGNIKTYDEAFYRQFKLIIAGLDNLEARRWMNSMLISLAERDEDGNFIPETIIPYIDGGTEGFKGQARLILPRITSCFDCTMDFFPPQTTFALCTIANTPRIPEHCIIYAAKVLWPKEYPSDKLDNDNPDHMKWVYEAALARASSYGIQGVTYFKTLGVVKNIIPAVASTNAIVAAACVSETLKLLTFCAQSLNTYISYMGEEGVYCNTFTPERKEDCMVCCEANEARPISLSRNLKLSDFLERLSADPSFQLKAPSVVSSSANLYMRNPPFLEAATRGNLSKCLGELISNGDQLSVTDSMLRDVSLIFKVTLV